MPPANRTRKQEEEQTVAITGMGIISSVGQGIPAFRAALKEGRGAFSCLNYPILSFPVIGAIIAEMDFSQSLSQFPYYSSQQIQHLTKIARSLPRPTRLALLASMEAWQQAGLAHHAIDPTRCNIVVGGQNTACHYQYDFFPKFCQQPDYLSPSYALHFLDTDYVGVLSEVFNILGEGFTVGGSSATGNVALLRAYDLIRCHHQDICLVVGAMADLSPMELQGFHNLGAMGGAHFANAPNEASRPFDQAHEGFIYGQATACLILESLASARNRQVPILGYLLGGALTLDGNRLTNPSKTGELGAMQQAIQQSGITLAQINYINTHGTSAPLGDETEIAAIESLLGEHYCQAVKINATKSITGHCLWSAGIVEAIATIIQMQEGFLHPSVNLHQPISNYCQFVPQHAIPFTITCALSNSFGFGGINTSIVLSRTPHQQAGK